MPRRGGRSGRLLPCDRVTDDRAEIINANIAPENEHRCNIIDTEQSVMNDKCQREYRNHLKHNYKWCQKYPTYKEYYNNGTRILSASEKNDIVKMILNIIY